MRKTLFIVFFAITGFFQMLTAQVNGTATTPVVSSDPNDPIYFYIESASDGSFTLSGYTGDFRGEVIISPATSETKLIHNTLASAPTPDHALWYIVKENGINVLKNKATGYYMSGSYNASTTKKEFTWLSLASNQFLIRTTDVGSYTCTWKDNLCNRYSNQGLDPNSLAAWYFIVANPEKLTAVLKLSLESKLSDCRALLNNSTEGEDFGQYTTASRTTFAEAITEAQTAYDDPECTLEFVQTIIQYIDQAKKDYMATQNKDIELLVSTKPDQNRWYWIKSYATASPYCFNKVISTGGRAPGSKYTFENKTATPSDNQLFRFELTEDKTKILNIIDKKGNRVQADGTISDASTAGNDFSLVALTDGIAFWIQPTSLTPLSASESGSIYNWKFMAGGASSWVFEFAKETAKILQPRTITVSSANSTMGAAEITGTGQTTVTNMEEKVSVTAIPNAGYFFTKWTNLAGDSISSENPYVYTDATDSTLVANFENGYYRDMKRYYTSAKPSVQCANRYLTDIVATAGGIEQTIISNVDTIPNPIDSTVTALTLIGNAILDYTATPIAVPVGTTSFDLKCVGRISDWTIENLKWTQQNVFVDWNKDFDFLDENEAGSVCTTGEELIAPTGYTRTITIPGNLPEGTYRMRVIYHEPSNANDWSVSIWANNYIRNGIAYDFSIRYGAANGIDKHNANNIKAFVNGGKLNVINAENTQMIIRDIAGRTLSAIRVNSSVQEFDAPAIRGVYFISFKSENGEIDTIKVLR